MSDRPEDAAAATVEAQRAAHQGARDERRFSPHRPGPRVSGRWAVIAFAAVAPLIIATYIAIMASGVTPQQKNRALAELRLGLAKLAAADEAEGNETRDVLLNEALNSLDRALGANPRLNSAYGWRGEVYLRTGELDRAVRDFSTAIVREADVGVNRGGRGEAYLQNGQPERAIPDLQAALAWAESGKGRETADEAAPPINLDPRRRSPGELQRLLEQARRQAG